MLPRQEDLVSERRLRRLVRKIVTESNDEGWLDVTKEADSFSGKLNKIRAELDKGNLDAAAKMYADMNDNPAYFGGDLEAIRFEFDETRDFFEDASAAVAREFEKLAYKHLSDKSKKSVASSPYKNELRAISNSFTSLVTPDEVKFIVYQPRVRKGQLANVNMEDNDSMLGGMATGMTPEEAKRYGTTLEKVMAALDSMGAQKRTRRKSVKRDLPYYD